MRSAFPAAAGPLICAAFAYPTFAQDSADGGIREVERRTQVIKEAAAPSVVSVTVTTRVSPLPHLVFPGLVIGPATQQPERIEGTGFFVFSRGLIVTTCDLVANAAHIEVRLHDGTVKDASVLGVDGPYRLAVLRTSAPERVPVLQHSARVEAGPSTIGWFFAPAGGEKPPESAAASVDVQVASVRPAPESGASYDRYLCAPISIASGAAGGPLVGGDCVLLGMAVGSLVSRRDCKDASAGMRFPRMTLFVRGDDIADAVRQIAETGTVERPAIGVMMVGRTNRIDTLLAGSPAEAAGLAEGDTIVAVGVQPVAASEDLARALLRRRAGETVRFTVERAGERLTKNVTLAPSAPTPVPTRAPIPGAVIELTDDAAADPVFTIASVEEDSPAGRAGLRVGDRLVAVDDRCPLRFISRHAARPGLLPPTKIEVRRGGETVELTLSRE